MTAGVSSRGPGERVSVVSNGPARLFVREVGSGFPIVALHGGPDFDHEYLLPELDRLGGRFRVVYYDQRGRGRSFTGEGPGDVTVASEIDDLDRVRASTGSERIAVLGHSWGTILAMEYAIRHPDRVSHLILMNSAPASHADAIEFRRGLSALRTPAEARRMAELRGDPTYLSGDVAAEAELYRIHFRPAVRDNEQLEEVVGRLRVAFTPESIVAARAIEYSLYDQTWSREDYDLLPGLRALDIPALVLHGDRDFVPEEIARRTAAALRRAKFVVLGDCGHFAYIEQPDRVVHAITALLKPGEQAG